MLRRQSCDADAVDSACLVSGLLEVKLNIAAILALPSSSAMGWAPLGHWLSETGSTKCKTYLFSCIIKELKTQIHGTVIKYMMYF